MAKFVFNEKRMLSPAEVKAFGVDFKVQTEHLFGLLGGSRTEKCAFIRLRHHSCAFVHFSLFL